MYCTEQHLHFMENLRVHVQDARCTNTYARSLVYTHVAHNIPDVAMHNALHNAHITHTGRCNAQCTVHCTLRMYTHTDRCNMHMHGCMCVCVHQENCLLRLLVHFFIRNVEATTPRNNRPARPGLTHVRVLCPFSFVFVFP